MKKFNSFAEFWPFYLSQHSRKATRWLHFGGVVLVISTAVTAAVVHNFYLLLLMPVVGYAPAWIGHALIEGNKPATFTNPFYSLLGDFKMFALMLMGKL